MENYKLEFTGEGKPKELIEQLEGIIESIKEYEGTAYLDGLNVSEEDGYPFTYLIENY